MDNSKDTIVVHRTRYKKSILLYVLELGEGQTSALALQEYPFGRPRSRVCAVSKLYQV